MQALLSPHSSTALAFQGQTAFLVGPGKPPQALPPVQVAAWLSAHEEMRWHSAESFTAVERSLSLYSRRREALDLALIGLDEELSVGLRDEAQQELENLLADPAVADWLLNLFHLRPLPAEAGVGVALFLATNRRRVRAWLEAVTQRQTQIAESWAAWSVIPDAVLQPAGGRQALIDAALEKGLFVRTVGLLAEGQSDKAKFEALLCLQGVAGGRQIAEAWLRPLTVTAKRPHIEDFAVEQKQRKKPKTKPQKQTRSYDRVAALRNVGEQKAEIIRLMRSGQWEKADLAVNGLLDYQRRFGGGSYAAKSLCDLAVEAKELGRHSFQLKLTSLAIEQNPEDGWAWAQHGDALLLGGHLQEALQTYENSVGFGQFVVGRSGQAEALKEMGRYPEALAAYEATAQAHPESVVARNGRAEVLKAMGRYPEALAAYEATVEAHPQDVVAKAGRAEVLKAMDRYPEALAAYEATVEAHPQDVVAKAGRAEVLKAMDRYPEALAAYEATAQAHPESVVAKAGRAEVLKAMGRYPDALAAYEATAQAHPESVVARNGRAEVLKAMGRYPEALAAYEATVEAHPQDVVAKAGRAEVLKAMGRLSEASSAYAAIMEQHPENLVVRSSYAIVLFMLGEFSTALDLLPRTQPEPFGDWIGWHIRGMALLRQGQLDEALPIFEQGAGESPTIHRDYFRTALAMARIMQQDWARAQEQIIQVSSPELRRVGNVVWLQIHAAQGNRDGMERALAELGQGNPPALVIELTEELRLRFLEKKQGRHDEQWLRERTVDCLALAA